MALDVDDLTAFYASPLGAWARAEMMRTVDKIWPSPAGRRDVLLGYGFAAPLLDLWPDGDWHLLMPVQQGVRVAQDGLPRMVSQETHWPIRDDSVNRLIALHGLEAAAQVELVLDEAWRVLQPNGRALFIVANRRGLWARRDQTPFGAGRPFSGRQVKQFLRRSGFLPGQMRPALMLPPYLPLPMLKQTPLLQKAMALVAPQLGGVWLVEAIKQVPAPLSVQQARKARARALAGIPRPAYSPKL